ncbi:MAG: ferredoxin [Candidatus Aenigmatarchaeota archaeon]
MRKYIVQYNRKKCIGVGVCEAVNPERWSVSETRKADFRGAVFNEQTQLFELEINQNELDRMQIAADGCPKHAIQIIDKEAWKK